MGTALLAPSARQDEERRRIVNFPGDAQTATISSGSTTSEEIDLGDWFPYLWIEIPTITSADLTILVSRTTGGTFKTLGGSNNIAAVGTGNYTTIFKLGLARYIKIESSVNQEADRSFTVIGLRGVGV
jgi:hypothetical protein